MTHARHTLIITNTASAANVSAPEKADIAVSEAVAPYRKTAFIKALSAFSKLGDQPPMRVLSGASGVISGNERLKRAGLRMFAAHTLATLAKDFIKHRIDRTRPEVMTGGGRYKMEPGHSEEHGETSFPSGHSAGAVAVSRAFGREFPGYARLSDTAAVITALGQITRGKHFPTDVMAGCVIGFLSEWIAAGIIRPAGGKAEADFAACGALERITARTPLSQSGSAEIFESFKDPVGDGGAREGAKAPPESHSPGKSPNRINHIIRSIALPEERPSGGAFWVLRKSSRAAGSGCKVREIRPQASFAL